jgi:hypothetical protein
VIADPCSVIGDRGYDDPQVHFPGGPVTAFTQEQATRKLAEIDVRKREAWDAYNESLRDLAGREYEDAEGRSWERLQKRLQELDGERQLVVGD